MRSAPTRVRIDAVEPGASAEILTEIDRVLRRARPDLVPHGAHLESGLERASDADGDRSRILLVATTAGRVLGLVDARAAWPHPDDLTVSQLAVEPSARRRGIARALLKTALRVAEQRRYAVARIHATTLPHRPQAAEFWTHLGLQPDRKGRFTGTADLLRERKAGLTVPSAERSDGRMNLVVRKAEPAELEACLDLRRRVFVLEQGVPASLEVDGRDDECRHVVARAGQAIVGTARLRSVDSETGKAERVCVEPGQRVHGVGRALMAELESLARGLGHRRMRLSAQQDVIEFYRRLGYRGVGGKFMEAGIVHLRMDKELTGPPPAPTGRGSTS